VGIQCGGRTAAVTCGSPAPAEATKPGAQQQQLLERAERKHPAEAAAATEDYDGIADSIHRQLAAASAAGMTRPWTAPPAGRRQVVRRQEGTACPGLTENQLEQQQQQRVMPHKGSSSQQRSKHQAQLRAGNDMSCSPGDGRAQQQQQQQQLRAAWRPPGSKFRDAHPQQLRLVAVKEAKLERAGAVEARRAREAAHASDEHWLVGGGGMLKVAAQPPALVVASRGNDTTAPTAPQEHQLRAAAALQKLPTAAAPAHQQQHERGVRCHRAIKLRKHGGKLAATRLVQRLAGSSSSSSSSSSSDDDYTATPRSASSENAQPAPATERGCRPTSYLAQFLESKRTVGASAVMNIDTASEAVAYPADRVPFPLGDESLSSTSTGENSMAPILKQSTESAAAPSPSADEKVKSVAELLVEFAALIAEAEEAHRQVT